jgi:hypothetical protein
LIGAIEQQQQPEEGYRIYLATDGLTSCCTKNTYGIAFNHFIKSTVKNNNLEALLDTKQNVIESKIIDHIKYLLESILPVNLRYQSITM